MKEPIQNILTKNRIEYDLDNSKKLIEEKNLIKAFRSLVLTYGEIAPRLKEKEKKDITLFINKMDINFYYNEINIKNFHKKLTHYYYNNFRGC